MPNGQAEAERERERGKAEWLVNHDNGRDGTRLKPISSERAAEMKDGLSFSDARSDRLMWFLCTRIRIRVEGMGCRGVVEWCGPHSMRSSREGAWKWSRTTVLARLTPREAIALSMMY